MGWLWICILCQGINSIFWILSLAVLMSFVCQIKPKTFSGVLLPEPQKGFFHGPIGRLTAHPSPPMPQTPSSILHYTCVSCSYNLGNLGATNVVFCFCIKAWLKMNSLIVLSTVWNYGSGGINYYLEWNLW